MDAGYWERIQAVFGETADLPPEEQAGRLGELCGSDRALAADVWKMLEEDARSESLLDAPLGQLACAVLQHPVATMVQRQIGPYRLLRLIGEGGMGVVYLAERTDIGGLVAIKLLRDAWLSPMRRERFAEEQVTLAQLNHPGIARIYDANTTEDGTPWFVMEYADGRPLTAYLRERGASVREDLLLFRRVCEAVQYAHSLGIIHRDLKPANILVTPAGEVKLLDFGISKRLEIAQGDHSGDRETTVAGLRMMTPAYAAPEQRVGGAIGVFTDIYALGVILYEVLTGCLPAAAEPGRRMEFVSPSERVRRTGRALPGRDLPKREWADLDVLCMTALAAELERRYASMEAFLRDVSACLGGSALEARRQGWFSRSGALLRRDRAALIRVGAGAAVLVLSIAPLLVGRARARDLARSQAARTERLQHFTESLFVGGDPGGASAGNGTAGRSLERGEVEAEGLREDPRLQADMFATLGGAYQRMGRLDKAEAFEQRALAIHMSLVGVSYSNLIGVYFDRKDYPAAEEVCRKALAFYGQTIPGDHPDTAIVHMKLGRVLLREQRFADAELETLKGYEYLAAHVGAHDRFLIGARRDLGEIEEHLGKPAEAARYRAELEQADAHP